MSNNWIPVTPEVFKKEGLGVTDPVICYVCDRRACAVCYPQCTHTKNISHAVNFENINGDMIEKVNMRHFEAASLKIKEPVNLEKKLGLLKEILRKSKGDKTNE